ncbi:MAG: response regulator [Deltaproteobacteria bacterium]|nr:response regulator [Deltaproteobacteria bacterium]
MAKKILIVDDDPDAILFLSTVLKDQGYATVEARDGQEGWERLKVERPDLVLLDLMMPRKSGISFLTDMKQEESLRRVPVIMVTGVAGETGIELNAFFKGGQEGEKDPSPFPLKGYIEKPIDPDRLLLMIKEVIGQP